LALLNPAQKLSCYGDQHLHTGRSLTYRKKAVDHQGNRPLDLSIAVSFPYGAGRGGGEGAVAVMTGPNSFGNDDSYAKSLLACLGNVRTRCPVGARPLRCGHALPAAVALEVGKNWAPGHRVTHSVSTVAVPCQLWHYYGLLAGWDSPGIRPHTAALSPHP
jgi:hypothetical protein